MLSNEWIHKNLFKAYLLYFIAASVLYKLATNFPLYEPAIIPVTSIDEMIPLIPSSAYIYFTYFLLGPVILFANRQDQNSVGLYKSLTFSSLCHLAFVNLVPTKIEAADWGQANHFATNMLVNSDTNFAALPSGHVAFPVCILIVAFINKLKLRQLYYVWGPAVALSTLTTKQHYLHDFVGGLWWGVISGLVSHTLFFKNAKSQ